MKSKEEFKKKFENGEFNEDLENITSAEDVVKFARQLGYELTIEDVLTTELGEEQLALVAGGKKDTHNKTNHNNNISGNGNMQVTL